MKYKMCFLAVLTGAVALPHSLLAQEYGPEDTTSIEAAREVDEEDDEEDRVRWDFRVTNELHTFDNLDMRPLDESTPQDILDTDDRHTFGYTSAAIGASYDLLEDTTFNFGASLSGMWGNDQLGATTEFGALAYIYDLSVDWTAVETDNLEISTSVGRQDFSIGGAADDFFFKDIVDGVTIESDLGAVGRVRLLALDVFGDSGRPDNVDFLRFVNASKQTTNNFRGKTNVYRYGGVYELLDVLGGLDVRAFGFGSYIGAARAAQEDDATSTGTDRTSQGTLGNFVDNDSTWMAGARTNYQFDFDAVQLGLMGEYARSGGIDRKARHLGHYDVQTDGNAFGGGAEIARRGPSLDLDGRARFFYADGASFTGDEGLLFNHGFVSMKGSEIGGLNMERYAGWHPSAYVSGFSGIADTPQDLDRKAGSSVLQAGAGVLFSDTLRLDLDVWHFRDTGESNLDEEDIDRVSSEIAWGYSEADLQAQQRLGKSLGTEFNGALTLVANDALSFYGIGGIFFPGEFYEFEIERNAGTALGAPESDPDQLEEFWIVAGGATLAF